MGRRRDIILRLQKEGGQVRADFTGRVGDRDFDAETRATALYEELRGLNVNELTHRAGVPTPTAYPRQALIALIVNNEGGTMSEQTAPTATSLVDGIGEALPNPKGTYHRLRVGTATLGYAMPRKDGVLLEVPAEAAAKAPAKLKKELTGKGSMSAMRVNAKNEQTARALLEWLAAAAVK